MGGGTQVYVRPEVFKTYTFIKASPFKKTNKQTNKQTLNRNFVSKSLPQIGLFSLFCFVFCLFVFFFPWKQPLSMIEFEVRKWKTTLFLENRYFYIIATLVIRVQSQKTTLLLCFLGWACIHIANLSAPHSPSYWTRLCNIWPYHLVDMNTLILLV